VLCLRHQRVDPDSRRGDVSPGRTHEVAELDQAHSFLRPLLGSTLAPTLFAVALLCCGLNSTITATLSGQIVMEGFLTGASRHGCAGW